MLQVEICFFLVTLPSLIVGGANRSMNLIEWIESEEVGSPPKIGNLEVVVINYRGWIFV